jgi:polyisoprenoid-binding protein YceI
MSRITFLILFSPLISFGQARYVIWKEVSTLTWECNYVVGTGGHRGTLEILSGNITMDEKEKLVKGDFVLDMNSITNTEGKKEESKYILDMNTLTSTGMKPKKSRNDLEKHLISADFFDTNQFPTGNFSIVQVDPVIGKTNEYTITGYLSLKGVTNAIRFPALIVLSKGLVSAKAEITIDRTKWNIIYQSGSIFTNLKDGVISDEIRLSLDLLFRKAGE